MKRFSVLSIVVAMAVVLPLTGCINLSSLYYATNPNTKEEYKLGKAAGDAERLAREKVEAVQQGYIDGRGAGMKEFYIGGAVRSGRNYGAFSYNSAPYGYGHFSRPVPYWERYPRW